MNSLRLSVWPHNRVTVRVRSHLATTTQIFDVVSIITGPQRSWGKVMFLQASVILLTGGGGLPQCMLGYHPPGSIPPRWEQSPPPPGMQSCSLCHQKWIAWSPMWLFTHDDRKNTSLSSKCERTLSRRWYIISVRQWHITLRTKLINMHEAHKEALTISWPTGRSLRALNYSPHWGGVNKLPDHCTAL